MKEQAVTVTVGERRLSIEFDPPLHDDGFGGTFDAVLESAVVFATEMRKA